jgi:hypothetical protein
MNIIKKIRFWLGWCPGYQSNKRTDEFAVENINKTVLGGGSSNPISVIIVNSSSFERYK